MANPVTSGLVLECLAGNITGVSDGTGMYTWPDTSGNNNNLTTWNNSYRPQYYSSVTPTGYPAIFFPRDANVYAMRKDAIVNLNSGTTIVVCNCVDAPVTGEESWIACSRTTGSYRWFMRFVPDGDGDVSHYIGDAERIDQETFGWGVRVISSDGTAKERYLDGGSLGEFTDSYSDSTLTRLAIGAYLNNTGSVTANSGLGGYVAAVLHYNRKLTDQEVADISAWLIADMINDGSALAVSSIADQHAGTGQPISIQASTFVTGGTAPYTYELLGTYSGVSIDADSGEISGRIDSAVEYTGLQVRITDAESSSVTSNTFSLTVSISSVYGLIDQVCTDENPNAYGIEASQIASVDLNGTTYQIANYWSKNLKLVIAKRVLGGSWTTWEYDGTNGKPDIQLRYTWDNHNSTVCELDKNGYIHVSYDHHNNPLNYRKSLQPVNEWAGGLTSAIAMNGVSELSVAYPAFIKDRNGELHFVYRDGGSGNGDTYLKTYNASDNTWENFAGTANGKLVQGIPDRNAYHIGGPKFDENNRLWFVAFWRESTYAVDAHDIIAAVYDGAWKKLDGTAQAIPITVDNCDTVLDTGSPVDWYPAPFHDFVGTADGRMVAFYERRYADTFEYRVVTRTTEGVVTDLNIGSITSSDTSHIGTAEILYNENDDKFLLFVRAASSADGFLKFETGVGDFTWEQSTYSAEDLGAPSLAYDMTQWRKNGALYYAINPRKTVAGNSAPYAIIYDDSYVFSADDTAPVLTSPSATATSVTTATASITTDDGNGTLYFLASTNATESAATVKAALSQAVTTSGEQTVNVEGLDPSTTYYPHFVQTNGAGLDSEVVTGAAFTTPEYVDYGDPVAFDGEFSDVTLAQLGNAAVILRVWRVS